MEGKRKGSLTNQVAHFLERRISPGRPVLLAHSGGPDSTALLHLLIGSRNRVPLDIHIAHVDHGWRKESCVEAAHLKAQADQLGMPFHLKSLSLSEFHLSNLEEQGRQKRFEFFFEMYKKTGAQALFLGHHQDDQAEVVLKRLLEGASLPFLGGMSFDTERFEMRILKPLLCTDKKAILHWLRDRKIAYFEDSTNRDLRYLRARMREEMIPLMEESFGKGIKKNLCRLGEEAEELRSYFLELNRPLLCRGVQEGSLDLKPHLPLSRIQLRFLFKEWARHIGVVLPRELLECVISALLEETTVRKQFLSSCFIINTHQKIITFNKINI